MGRGIDYGMGQTNIDRETGIRFGVINMNDLAHWAWDEAEADYGPPTCGHCGTELGEVPCGRFPCPHCGKEIDEGMGDCWRDEPIGHDIDSDGLKAEIGSDGDAFVILSPYFTRAAFCSPCAPGACYLTDATDDGERAYCFGHDWFEDGKAPYPVYSVATGELVPPPSA